jgi:uncharacterized protein (TIGR03435 family)
MRQPAKIRLLFGFVLAALLTDLPLVGQAQSPVSQFEVASIKPNPPGTSEAWGAPVLFMPGGRTLIQKATLNEIIQYAYQLTRWPLESWQVAGGPSWISSERYDIEGKAITDAGSTQMRLMLRSLLEDRFRLRVHWETRALPVYELTAARGGIRLKPGTQAKCRSSIPDESELPLPPPSPGEPGLLPCGEVIVGAADRGAGAEGHLEGKSLTMPILVSFLTNFLGRTVIDRTGFSETFDFQLTFNPGDNALEGFAGPGERRLTPTAELSGVSIFTSLQEQLGLRLESAKGPVQVLVVDSVSKPTEN